MLHRFQFTYRSKHFRSDAKIQTKFRLEVKITLALEWKRKVGKIDEFLKIFWQKMNLSDTFSDKNLTVVECLINKNCCVITNKQLIWADEKEGMWSLLNIHYMYLNINTDQISFKLCTVC